MGQMTTDDEEDSIASSPMITEVLFADSNSNSVEIESLLEKQLLMEKQRVNHLSNDNERLLSQNIGLCQAIKQQKARMDSLSATNDKLQQQVSKLFLTVRTLGKSNQTNSAKDQEIQSALKDQFLILKTALIEKENHIKHLSVSLETTSKSLQQKIKETEQMNESMHGIKVKCESEKAELERTVQTHLDAIAEFNSTMNSMQKAMDAKQTKMAALEQSNQQMLKLQMQNENKIKQMANANEIDSIAKDEKDQIIASLNAKIKPLQDQLSKIKNLCQQNCEKMDVEKKKYDKMSKELEWWKREAIKLEKENDSSVSAMHKLKSQMDGKETIIDQKWKRRCFVSIWHRFAAYETFQYRIDQMRDVLAYCKQKFIKMDGQPMETQNGECFGDSFKISMIKSLKGISDIDVEQLLLCQDPKQLTDFLLKSNMTSQTQLKVAAKLLPIVESYRVNLQKDINQKIERMTRKSIVKII